MRRINFLFLVVLLTFNSMAFALESDQNELMHIKADSVTANYKTGIDIYLGNVLIQQGTTELHADKIITYKENHKLVKAIAFGKHKRAEYSTLTRPGEARLVARAKTIKFFPLLSTAELIDTVHVIQGKNTFQGPKLIYNMKDQTITAPASNTERSSIIIDPQSMK